jgi:hypothetical protein
MPASRVYSADDDALIVRLRAEGASWRAIAPEIGEGRGWVSIRDHAYRLNLIPRVHSVVRPVPPPPEYEPMTGYHREPMRAFHPVSWGAIWAGLMSRP